MKTREALLACALNATIAIAPLAGCASQNASSSSSASANTSQQSSTNSSTDAKTADESTKFILCLGTNDKDTNQPVYTPTESKDRAKAVLIKNFGGYTIQEAEGGWKGDDGTVYQEYTLVIHLSDTDIDKVHAAAKELINEFHQSSVLIDTEHVTTEFYEEK